MSEIIWFCSVHKSSGYIPHFVVPPFCGNLWRKVRGKRFGDLHWRAWKNAGFCHVRNPGNLSMESEAWWCLSFTTFCFLQKNLPEVQDFFFPWCLATEKGWGWQNEDAAGSWGEQKEGKDRRLAEDAGESGSRALPWESRAQSAAECTLAAASNGKGSSGENSMSFPFLWVFQFISTLAGAAVPVQWQSAVVVAEICGMGPNISAFHKSHSRFIGAQ